MVWTAEAVEELKSLALEGRSASAIAAALGAASRNAVIGKASRMGIRLNGDGRVSMAQAAHEGAGGRPMSSGRTTLRLKSAPAKRSPAPSLRHWPRRTPSQAFANAEVGDMRRVAFEDMQALVCRWPLGDPTSADFTYCGLKSADRRPYCPGHCRMAYKPPNVASQRPLAGKRAVGTDQRSFA